MVIPTPVLQTLYGMFRTFNPRSGLMVIPTQDIADAVKQAVRAFNPRSGLMVIPTGTTATLGGIGANFQSQKRAYGYSDTKRTISCHSSMFFQSQKRAYGYSDFSPPTSGSIVPQFQSQKRAYGYSDAPCRGGMGTTDNNFNPRSGLMVIPTSIIFSITVSFRNFNPRSGLMVIPT